MDILQGLNEVQLEAVKCTEGPMMIQAGAGSGKTRVLTMRIAYLMQNGVDPFNILSLTFTNKAAREMKERIGKVVGESEAKNLWMGTFHSIFARILRFEHDKLNYPSNFTIYDSSDTLSVITKLIKEMNLDKAQYKPKDVQYRISQYKNSLITPRAYANSPELQEYDASTRKPKLGEIYTKYCERCYKSGAMDFDDLLLKTNELITRFPDVLAKYQDRFRYILVDEYQDTNHSQYLIVKALASRFENICVVGDDAQSIYGFRGANIENILNFTRDYTDTKIFRLEQNYRSSSNIVKAANSIIKHNQNQLEKNVWTQNGNGEKIKVFRAYSDLDEAAYVVRQIIDHKMNHQLKNSDFAILYRTNAQSRAMEDALRRRNIAYRIYGGTSFYQRKEVKDLVAYLRLAVNQNDEEAFLRIINNPTRGIGQTTIDRIILHANENQMTAMEVIEKLPELDIKINAGTRAKLNDFHIMIRTFHSMLEIKNAYEIVEYVSKSSGLYRSMDSDKTPEGVMRLENMKELINSVHGYVDEQAELEDGNVTLAGFLENIALATDQDNEDENTDRVALMTIHLSKGLEFPTVFITGLEEELFPSFMSMSSREDIEEERRLFYVALTRAEKRAFLTYSLSRYRYGKSNDCEPSRFLEEIDESYLSLDFSETPKMNKSAIGNFDSSPKSRPSSYKPSNKPDVTPNFVPKRLKKIDSTPTYSEAPSAVQYAVGDRVEHQRFGAGQVIAFSGEGTNQAVHVKFDNSGDKKLLIKYAKLNKLP